MVIHFSTILQPRENPTVNLTEMMRVLRGGVGAGREGGREAWVGGRGGLRVNGKRAFSCSKMSSVRTSMKGRKGEHENGTNQKKKNLYIYIMTKKKKKSKKKNVR